MSGHNDKLKKDAGKSTPKKDEARTKVHFNTNEVILIVGTEQHSKDYGEALMFPAQAVREVRENFLSYPHLTIIIFTDGYTPLSLDIIKRDAKSWNPTLYFKKINSTSELIKYINEGDSTVNRTIIKVDTIKIFSHGYPLSLEFGLDGSNESSQSFGIDDITKLQINAFKTNPSIYSYACRTGNSDTRPEASIATRFYTYTYDHEDLKFVKPENSLAQKLSDHIDAKVFAFIRRSEYGPTWNDLKDTSGYGKTRMTIESEDANGLGSVLNPKNFGQRNHYDEILWNPKGALKPPTSGDSPRGLPKGIYLFEKNKRLTLE